MASTVPAKSQPLHNFSLPHLKWTKNHTNNHHRGRRLADSSLQQCPPPDSAMRQPTLLDSVLRQPPMFDSAAKNSPARDYTSEWQSGYVSPFKDGFVSESRKISVPQISKQGLSFAPTDHMIDDSGKEEMVSDVDAGFKEIRSKIFIRLRTKNKSDDVPNEGKTSAIAGEVEELVAKTWNLRPRRPINKRTNANGGTRKIGGAISWENKAQLPRGSVNRQESIWLRSIPEADVAEKKKKRKFSISLSREDIEEDVFALTGSKPPRRPKKRAKNVQKQLDTLFPGLWLCSITPDSYKVSEVPLKG